MAGKQNHICGFTVIEIMAVLVVAGLLMSVAYPKFTSFLRMMDMRTAVANVQRQLTVAKVKAVSDPQFFCGVFFNSKTAIHSASVFLDMDSMVYDYSPTGDKLYTAPYTLPEGMKLQIVPDTLETIVFRGNGSAHANGKVIITASLSKNTMRSDTIDVLASTGRIKVLR